MGGLASHASPPGLAANYLRSATTLVNVSSATAPTVGQVLTATGDSAATWQTTSSSGVSNLIDATNADYGLSTSGTAAANTTALGLANTAAVAAGKRLWIPYASSHYSVNAITFTAPVVLDGILAWSSGAVAFNGGTGDWTISQHFAITGTGTATFSTKKTIEGYAEWWGAVGDSTGAATTNTTAINAAIVALKRTQLLGSTYYHDNTINHNTGGHTLCGIGGVPINAKRGALGPIAESLFSSSPADAIGSIDTTGNTSVLCCTSGSVTGLDIYSATTTEMRVHDLFVTRNVAPVISSNCIGVKIRDGYCTINEVVASESMTGFKIHACVLLKIRDCDAYRWSAGTGAGTDYWKGFWADGTAVSGISGGNASLYIQDTYACALSTLANTVAYNFDLGYADIFCRDIEGGVVVNGIKITGNNNTTSVSVKNGDFRIIGYTMDTIYGNVVDIQNTDLNGNITILGGEVNCMSGRASTVAHFYISNNNGNLTIRDPQILGYSNGAMGLYAINSKKIKYLDAQTIECTGEAVKLSGVTDSTFTPAIQNDFYNGKGIVCLNVDRSIFAATSTGSKTIVGYNFDSACDYNEINCTGINPAGLTGGLSANKLIINSVQITATGLSGTNLVSGVMA